MVIVINSSRPKCVRNAILLANIGVWVTIIFAVRWLFFSFIFLMCGTGHAVFSIRLGADWTSP